MRDSSTIVGTVLLFCVAGCAGDRSAELEEQAKAAPSTERAAPPEERPHAPENAGNTGAPAGERAKAEWPQWRGPDRSGVSLDEGLLESWPAEGPPLLWQATVGKGYSSVAISKGILYTLGERHDAEWVVAVDTANGQQLWTRQIGPDYDNDKGGGPRSTPTIVGDRMYVLGASGDLHCLLTSDGAPVWHTNVLERSGGDNLRWGISESPLVDGDHVIVLTTDPGGSIVAFNRHSGEVVWQSKEVTDGPSYASAVLADVSGVRQIIHVTDRATVGVRAADGKLLWRYEKAANDTANCTTPIYRDGYVFVTSGYDTGAALLKLTSSGNETTAEEVYFTRDMMNHHGGVVLAGSHVYGFSNANLACLDFTTGKEMWRDRSVGKGSLTVADGMLYLLSEKGVIALARATPEGYQEVSRFEIEAEGYSWAHPVVSDGRLYIRNRSQLLCYDVRA